MISRCQVLYLFYLFMCNLIEYSVSPEKLNFIQMCSYSISFAKFRILIDSWLLVFKLFATWLIFDQDVPFGWVWFFVDMCRLQVISS